MDELINFTVHRYRNKAGEPTCAADFSTGRVCKFLRLKRLGTLEVCLLSPEITALSRRDNGEGTLIPGNWCPLWEEG